MLKNAVLTTQQGAKMRSINMQKLSTFPHLNIYAKLLIFIQNDGLWGQCGQLWVSYPHFHIVFCRYWLILPYFRFKYFMIFVVAKGLSFAIP